MVTFVTVVDTLWITLIWGFLWRDFLLKAT